MFSFLKKKRIPEITIICKTDTILINDQSISFPASYSQLVKILGEPSRELKKSKNYVFWDEIGIFCGYTDQNKILSIHIHQIKKNKTEYDTKQQFTGELFLNDENITNNEFSKISLGSITIHRLGSEKEIRYGFSLSINTTT